MTSRGSDYHFVGWWSVTTSISPHEKAGFSAITVFGYGLTNCPEPWKITLRWYLVHYNVMPKGLSISIWVGNETRYVGGFLKAVNQLLLLFVDQKNWKNVILLGRLFYLFLKYFLVMFFPFGEASEASPPDLKHRKSQLFAFCAVSCSESFTGVHFVRSSSVWKDAESVCLCVCVDHRGEISHCLNLRQTYRAKCT